MLGAQWVRQRADPSLARAAADLVAKIAAVIPEHLRPLLIEPASTAQSIRARPTDAIDMARVRSAIRTQGKLGLLYSDEGGHETRRIVWPIAVSYWESVRIIVAWCELRTAFRHFRTDRILEAEFLDSRYATPRLRLRAARKKELNEPSSGKTQTTLRIDALVE